MFELIIFVVVPSISSVSDFYLAVDDKTARV